MGGKIMRNSKIQVPNSKQISSTNVQNSKVFDLDSRTLKLSKIKKLSLEFEIWNLFGSWNLALGIFI